MGAGIVSLYSDVKSTTVNWLWYPFIVVGKISLLQGDPGDGKSTMMLGLLPRLLMAAVHRMDSLSEDLRESFINALKMVWLIRLSQGSKKAVRTAGSWPL